MCVDCGGLADGDLPVSSLQAVQNQDRVQELLAAVDKGNAGDVKLILEDPNTEVNGTNKVCVFAGLHAR